MRKKKYCEGTSFEIDDIESLQTICQAKIYMQSMVNLMVDCMEPLTKSWESKIEEGNGRAEIKVDEDLQNFSAEVISRACFGDSYSEGRQIVLKLREMLRALSRPNLLVEIAGLRYLPTRLNREIWRLNKEVRSLILKVTKENKEREEHTTNKNLLQAILQNAGDSSDTDDFIVDNCKTIYIAGHETTAITAVWCLLLLSINQEWQSRVRAEVVEILGGCPPDANSIQKMKTVSSGLILALYLDIQEVSFLNTDEFME